MKNIWILFIIVVCMVGGIIYQKVTEKKMVDTYNKKMKYQGVKIILYLYSKGEQKSIHSHSQYFSKFLEECEKLIKTASDGYMEILDEEMVEEIKKEQVALEIIYPEVINIPIHGRPYPITKLFIPLEKGFPDGVIFWFPDKENSSTYCNVFNYEGRGKFEKLIGKMDIKID